MSARRAKLAAVHATPEPRRYTIRPDAMYPANGHNQAAYAAAVAYLRDDRPQSIFTLDPDARRPTWCARPNQENAK